VCIVWGKKPAKRGKPRSATRTIFRIAILFGVNNGIDYTSNIVKVY